MTTPNLHSWFEGRFDALGLNLEDFNVCRLLAPFLQATALQLEKLDLLVGKIEIRPTHVRAYPLTEKEPEEKVLGWPDFIEKALPKGLFEACLDFSKGPTTPFPVPPPPPGRQEAFDAWKADWRRILFSEQGAVPFVVMNAHTYTDFRKVGRGLLDVVTTRENLRKGWMATLYENEECTGRSVQIWCSRSVPKDSLRLTFGVGSDGIPLQEGLLVTFKTIEDRRQEILNPPEKDPSLVVAISPNGSSPEAVAKYTKQLLMGILPDPV